MANKLHSTKIYIGNLNNNNNKIITNTQREKIFKKNEYYEITAPAAIKGPKDLHSPREYATSFR